MAFRAVSADYSAMNAEQVRKKLRDAIAVQNDATATSLSRLLRRSPGYLSDFLRGKKASLAAADSAKLEKALGLTRDSLLVTSRHTNAEPPSSPEPARNQQAEMLDPQIAQEYIRATIYRVFLEEMKRAPTEIEMDRLSRSSLELFEARRALSPNERHTDLHDTLAIEYRKGAKEAGRG